MKKHLLLFALLLASLIAIKPAFAADKTLNKISTQDIRRTYTTGIPIVGSFANGTFAGTMNIVQFVQSAGGIVAVASVIGILTDALGNTVGSVTDAQIQLPATNISSSCDALEIDLGSSDVDLLGTAVHVEPVALSVSADAAGSILCTITSLLNSPFLSFLVVGLLNSLLGVLG